MNAQMGRNGEKQLAAQPTNHEGIGGIVDTPFVVSYNYRVTRFVLITFFRGELS